MVSKRETLQACIERSQKLLHTIEPPSDYAIVIGGSTRLGDLKYIESWVELEKWEVGRAVLYFPLIARGINGDEKRSLSANT